VSGSVNGPTIPHGPRFTCSQSESIWEPRAEPHRQRIKSSDIAFVMGHESLLYDHIRSKRVTFPSGLSITQETTASRLDPREGDGPRLRSSAWPKPRWEFRLEQKHSQRTLHRLSGVNWHCTAATLSSIIAKLAEIGPLPIPDTVRIRSSRLSTI
jgi:hypothetical protein